VTIPITDDGSIEGNESFNFVIDNLEGNGTLLAPRTASVTIDDNDAIQAAGNGLLGEYFDSRNLTNREFTRVDSAVNFNWGTGGPDSRVGVNDFSVRWTGQIEARHSELYTFNTRTDDGVRLFVNNQLIIDEFGLQAATNHTGQIFLEAGVLYDIRLEYFEAGGQAEARLRWSSASQDFQVVPRNHLYAADPPAVPGDNLVDETVYDGLTQPTSFAFSPDGRNTYIAEKSGLVKVSRDGNLQSQSFIDIRDQVNNTRDRGLLDIAVHPDFESNPYIYLLFTYDPPEVFDNVDDFLAGPDRNGNRAGRLIRVTADASTGYRVR